MSSERVKLSASAREGFPFLSSLVRPSFNIRITFKSASVLALFGLSVCGSDVILVLSSCLWGIVSEFEHPEKRRTDPAMIERAFMVTSYCCRV